MNKIAKLIPRKIRNRIKDKFYNEFRNSLRNTECKYKIYEEDKGRLEGKVAIVTGGSGAIGSAICFKLASEGAIVYVAGRNIDSINTVITQMENNNFESYPLILDVEKYDDIKEKFKQVYDKHGRIDILINNAGGSARDKKKEIVNQDIEIIESIINTNLMGTILCSKEAAKYMIKNKYGRIVNLGSVMGINGAIKYSDYCASKSGIIGFTKSLAMELAKYNITVNCVSPGLTEQTLFDKPLPPKETNGNYIGHLGKTDDIANTIEFFCRDDSSYIIGQNLIVDGGRSLGLKNN